MSCQAEASGGCTCGFHLALADFKRNLKDDDLVRSFQGTQLHHLTAEIAKIQQEQHSKRSLRYMKRLDPFLKKMEQYGKVIEIFANSQDIVAFIWGPLKFLLIAASSFNDALNSLLDAYQEIWEQFPLFEVYGSTLEARPYLRTILVWIYKDILDFHQEAMRYFKSRVRIQVFQAAWRNFLPTIRHIKENMARHRRLLAEGIAFVQLEELNIIRRDAQRRFEVERQAEVDRRRKETISWLNPYNSQLTLEKYREARISCPDAGGWLLKIARFRGWFDPTFCTEPLLWITGIPGAGKSVLASVIVDAAQELDVPENDICVAFFFCQPDDSDANTFVAVARSILAQLVTQNTFLIPQVYEQSSLSGEVTLSTNDLAKTLLTDVLSSCKNTYIIIDGLDACNRKEHKNIVSTFRTVVESLPPSQMHDIRCVFLCRDDPAARKDLINIPMIRITPADNKDDIEKYWKVCKSHLEAEFGPLDMDIVKIVAAQSRGMFLYATLMFSHLKSLSTLDELQQQLHSIPKELHDLYQRIVERLLLTENFQAKDIMKLLGQLACAKRPLKWYEVQGAAAIDLDNETVNFQKLPRGMKYTHRDLCGPLVEMRSDEDQSLDFIHPSAREYLLQHHFRDSSASLHFQFATLSVSYLTLPGNLQSVNTFLLPLLLDSGYYAFLEYAVSCWALHVQESLQGKEKEHPPDLEELEDKVDMFLDKHWKKNTSDTDNTPKSILLGLSRLKNFDSYDRICKAVAAVRRELTQHSPRGSEESPLDLADIVKRARDTLASYSEFGNLTDAKRALLHSLYGPNWFKCSMMNCEYFHQGFKSRQQLDQHITRHERPFLCMVTEPTECQAHTFGFTTKDALHRHLLAAHGIDVGDSADDLEFPLPPSLKRNADGEGGPSRFECPTCHKTFTRNHNLQNHLRAHRKEKPFPCNQCTQSFTRQYERNRHQALHTGQKRFICKGELASGGTWGCGKKFARQDKLASHFKSKSGRKCIQPLFMEEANGMTGEEWNARIAEILSSRFILDPEQMKPLITTLSSFPESWVRVEGREDVKTEEESQGQSTDSGLGIEEVTDGSSTGTD
ncbi:hypothetical protein QBC38DRAFT_493303 [Podospora fimiseda]|uniref:C2H2-type domain-containing protein n=1 Tax=Podospora fimiseda TaxID=252190 RepID=A0AAN6YLQ7_9PEZI|nr:hypothetical protein QBC38DRAFT_493303 [Podospora fimiseda]